MYRPPMPYGVPPGFAPPQGYYPPQQVQGYRPVYPGMPPGFMPGMPPQSYPMPGMQPQYPGMHPPPMSHPGPHVVAQAPPVLIPPPAPVPVPSPAVSINTRLQQANLLEKVSTVWVGKISPLVHDSTIRKLLDFCGPLKNWARVEAGGSMKTFGFAHFMNAEGAIRAMKILNGVELGNEALQLKLDSQMSTYIEEYELNVRDFLEKDAIDRAKSPDGGSEQVFYFSNRQEKDEEAKAKIEDIVDQVKSALETDEDSNLIVSKEVRTYREKQVVEDRKRREEEHEADQRRRRLLEEEQRRKDKEREREAEEVRRSEREWGEVEYRRNKNRARFFEDKAKELKGRKRKIEEEEEDEASTRRRIRNKEEKKRRIREREQDEAELEAERKEEEMRKQEQIKRELEEQERQKKRMAEEEEEARKRFKAEEEQRRREMQERLALSQQKLQQSLAKTQAKKEESPVDSRSKSRSPGPSNTKFSLSLGSGGGSKPSSSQPGSSTSSSANVQWSAEPEEDRLVPTKKIRLTTLDNEAAKQFKKEEAKALIEKIPTESKDVFAYAMDWRTIEASNIVDEKMRPWVVKKMIEILGEEEPTLTDYIVKKLKERSKPSDIVEQLKMVLDDEATVFVVKMWRFLIFSMLMA